MWGPFLRRAGQKELWGHKEQGQEAKEEAAFEPLWPQGVSEHLYN